MGKKTLPHGLHCNRTEYFGLTWVAINTKKKTAQLFEMGKTHRVFLLGRPSWTQNVGEYQLNMSRYGESKDNVNTCMCYTTTWVAFRLCKKGNTALRIPK